jgi:predicted glycosyltransferase
LIVTGEPDRNFECQTDKISSINHLSREKLREKIISSETVITQAGYTSIMDLIVLRKKAILIPTPGQTEQEYLADHLKNYNIFIFEKRESFQLIDAMKKLNELDSSFPDIHAVDYKNFTDVIHEFLLR